MLLRGMILAPSLVLILISTGPLLVQGISFQEDLRISLDQKAAIDKLRNRILSYITEPHMKEDIYLVKWLRVNNFDISLTERKLIENIQWRKENRMATIDQENFSDIATDREGRPLFIAFAGRNI